MTQALRIDLRIDVSGQIDLSGELHTAASVFLDPETLTARPVVIFGFPGGGYSRDYYDIRSPGLEGYSQAAYHVARGRVFVACDHLGVGESSLVDSAAYTYERHAAADAATVAGVLERLRAGTLSPGIAPITQFVPIGIGQSLGGCLLTVIQALYRPFAGVAFLGWSGLRTRPPAGAPRDASLIERRTYAYFMDDVPAALKSPEYSGLAGPPPPWFSRTRADETVERDIFTPGVMAKWASTIDVPVMVAAAERDVVREPHAEPAAYPASDDVTVYVLRGSAHMHNLATTREQLWRRLDQWAAMVAEAS